MVMNSAKAGEVEGQFEMLRASRSLGALNDSQLLSRYVNARDRGLEAEAAFCELVHRHGPLVLGICRQILRQTHDTDDAFQATFLVLVRKAASIEVGDSLAPWLCSVAFRIAHRARHVAARFHPIDEVRLEGPETSRLEEAFQFDVRPLIYEELDRLPGKFRDAIVLCHLEGKSHEEAARLLHSPIGTVSSRLARGRRLLRSRLERRGVDVSSAMFIGNWLTGSPTTIAWSLIESAITAATGGPVSSLVRSLTHGVLQTMMFRKLASISVAIVLFGAASGSFAVWAHWPTKTHTAPDLSQRPEQRFAPEDARPTTPNAGSAPTPLDAVTPQKAASNDLLVTDCPAGMTDCLPEYCPISMAANAVSKIIGHFHH